MKTTTATTHVTVNAYCPSCEHLMNIFCHGSATYDAVRETFNINNEMRSDDCEIQVECERCKETFLVTSIQF